MGIAWLLLMRTFANRPKRTILFLFGYALATGVMITLLAVGEAVLLQARDKNLVGGGDLILVPQGIDVESMKVGGISAMYYSIPHAKFILGQMLASSRFQNEIETVSPYLYSEMLYSRKISGRQIEPLLAEGSIPENEKKIKSWKLPWKNNKQDQGWITVQDQETFLGEIDRFHLPSAKNLPLDQWAEWHYFNFRTQDFSGYLSIMAQGDVFHDHGTWIVSLQIFDGNYNRYLATYPASKNELPLQKVDYVVGSNQIKIVNGTYEIDLDFDSQKRIHGKLRYVPVPNLYFPPVMLAEGEGFESGYVVPSIKGKYEGRITIGDRDYSFNGADGYHDHNWGIWQQPQSSGDPVHWNWGHAFSDEYALFFGEIFVKDRTRGLFAAVFDNRGFVTLFQPGTIHFSEPQNADPGIHVPQRLRFSQNKLFTSIELDGKAKSFASSPAGEAQKLYFIQYKMDYNVKLKVDGKVLEFPAEGNAETFVPTQALQSNFRNCVR